MTSPQPISRERNAGEEFEEHEEDCTSDESDIRAAHGTAVGVVLGICCWGVLLFVALVAYCAYRVGGLFP